ncbi:MAG: DNA-3-methyladenine glycosylase 2 family protein [Saprospiraceae bacterium]|nr:DNA-3-methyladenine glycosylase 2 family protein [Saprospiraceae bacterium]
MTQNPNSATSTASSSIVNPHDIVALLKLDSLFSLIFNTYRAPPNWIRPQGFVSLCRIILEQQVSLASANAHYLKLNEYLEAITPDHILKLSDTEMRQCQISRQKSVYLRALSSALIEKRLILEELSGMYHTEVRSKLTAIKGIGDWTTDIYLMFCLQSKDIFPIGDIAVVNTVKELTDAKKREDILLLADKWKPYRSLASYFLWHYYLKKRNRLSE